MLSKAWEWLLSQSLGPVRVRQSGDKCATCRYFTDHSAPDDEPDEVNGYCHFTLHQDYGEEYGGHWTHSESWCGGHVVTTAESKE